MQHGITVKFNPSFLYHLRQENGPQIAQWGVAIKGKGFPTGTEVYLESSRRVPMVALITKAVAQKEKDGQLWTLYTTSKPVPTANKDTTYNPDYKMCPWTDLESAVQATAVAHAARKENKPQPVPKADMIESHVKALSEAIVTLLAQIKDLTVRIDRLETKFLGILPSHWRDRSVY